MAEMSRDRHGPEWLRNLCHDSILQ